MRSSLPSVSQTMILVRARPYILVVREISCGDIAPHSKAPVKVPGDTNAFRQLPFHYESEIFLPHLRTVEFPNGNIDRIHFVELLTTRYARRVPLRHFVIPGEELELRIAISLGLTSVRDKVIGRLCGFATSVGAMMFIRDTSPQGKSGTCPTEIHFNYSSPPCI